MANDHYTRGYDPQPTQRVGSTDLKNEFQAVEGGFDSIQADTRRTLRQVDGAEIAPMPNAVSRALKLLSFDASGNPVMVAGGGRYRGDWVTATEYIVSDYFRDPVTKNIYSTLVGHTSSVLSTDISSGKVQLAINVADVEAAKVAAEAAAAVAMTQAGLATTNGAAQVALAADQVALATAQAGIATAQAGAATASASTATTQAGTATTQADIATTQAGIATTQAGIATTQAGIATTKAAEAAASAASISGGPVTSVNSKTGVVTLVPADIGLETASQVEMESGTETALRAMSPLRVAQAIAATGKGKITRSARTSNTALTAADIGKLIDITSGTFTQTFDAAASLGSGWFCYLRNSGTGDITLDPNGSEIIDGLTTYVMYPGEVRLVQCDGSALRSVVLNTFYKVFTSSGTFTKPPGYSMFSGLLWAAGNSGSRHATNPRGGGGGVCVPFTLASSVFSVSETITVGAGGEPYTGTLDDTGNLGGTSSIGTIIVTELPGAGLPSSQEGSGKFGVGFGTGWNGGSGSTGNVVGGSTIYGGAGGSGHTAAGGISKFGGSGGQGVSGANGNPGTAPGGGGGGSVIGGTSTQSGAGARGELRIWGII